VHASVRGSLKRGFSERFHLFTQVHRPPHTAKRGPFVPLTSLKNGLFAKYV
jgi:hypothetical protein